MIQLLQTSSRGPNGQGTPHIAPALIRPEDAPRPLWYRAAGGVERFRPLFTWAVMHKRWIKRYALPIAGATGLALAAWQRFWPHHRGR